MSRKYRRAAARSSASKGARSASSTSTATFYALRNSCPHQAARVCLGRVVGTALPSEVYEFKYGREGRILRCPWHEWEYDIATGESVFDPEVRIKTYPVEVTGGEIAVTVD